MTLPRVTQVLMWLPGEDSWRHLQGGSDVYHPSDTNDTSVPAVRGQIVTLIRPGFVVPIHEVIVSSMFTTMSLTDRACSYQFNRIYKFAPVIIFQCPAVLGDLELSQNFA